MTQQQEKEIREEWYLSKYGGSLMMYAPDGIPSVLNSNDELISDKVADFWINELLQSHTQTLLEVKEMCEKQQIKWKYKKGYCDNCSYMEHCGEYHYCEAYNSALENFITNLTKELE